MHSQIYGENLPKYLQTVEKANCNYDQQISAYTCSFNIKNTSEHTLFLNINSTFEKFMEVQSKIDSLKPGQVRQFSARFRPPNQLYEDQFIAFSYSLHPYPQFCAILDFHHELLVKLQFSSQNNQDIQIDSFLKQQSKNTQQQAIKRLDSGLFQQAIQLSEQAFILYRKNISCLITWSQAELRLGQLERASRKVELLFYHPNHPQLYKAMIIKAETILTIIQTFSQQHKLRLVIQAMKLLKKANEGDMASEQYEQRCNSAMSKYQQIKKQLLSSQRNIQFKLLVQKALSNFQSNYKSETSVGLTLRQHFKDKLQFQNTLKKLAKQQHKMYQQTPQYALDPINYEIYKEPVIIPSGVSLERSFLTHFFQKHGPSDPLTRAYLDPNFVFPNHTLRILVRNNPNLSKWLKFQEETTRM